MTKKLIKTYRTVTVIKINHRITSFRALLVWTQNTSQLFFAIYRYIHVYIWIGQKQGKYLHIHENKINDTCSHQLVNAAYQTQE